MLKQQSKLLTRLAVAIDIIVILLAFDLAYDVIQMYSGRLSLFRSYVWSLVIIVPVWLFLMTYVGMYDSMRTKSFSKIVGGLVKVHIAGGIITASCVYFIDPKGFSRFLLGHFLIFSLVFSIFVKSAIAQLLRYFRRRGYNSRNILIVGSGPNVQQFVDIIHSHSDWGLNIAGIVGIDNNPAGMCVKSCKYLGEIEKLLDICKELSIDEVVFSLPHEHLVMADEYLIMLQEMGITVRLVVDLYDSPTSRKELTMFPGDIPMLTYHSKAFDAGQLFLKRCLDIVGAVAGLIITGVMLPFVAAAIRLESPGPLFFCQDRVGENGRIFTCWKFRSMFVDAETGKKELMALNEMQGAMFKMKDDPRVTRVGRFIRKTSIDELPQFWNVLKGEMSLVGTRPPTPDEVATYEDWHRKRICIKPGITGLWQVSGRNQIQDFDEVVRLDIKYIEQWSLWLDIKLLCKTIWVVIVSKGAR